jgi:hypothetical protein
MEKWQFSIFGLQIRDECNTFPKTPISRLLKKTQRRGARKIDEGRRGHTVRWSEAIERNEAYEAFSAAC